VRDLLSSHIPKSRWRKPRNSGACLEFGVSEFRLPGNPGARPPVVAHPEIPMEETPKGRVPNLFRVVVNLDKRLGPFRVSALRKSREQGIACLTTPRIAIAEVPSR
jgi:hypothetical protein